MQLNVNIGQLLVIQHPAVPVTMNLFEFNFKTELYTNACCE